MSYRELCAAIQGVCTKETSFSWLRNKGCVKPKQRVSAGVLKIVCVCAFGNCHKIHWFGEMYPLLIASDFPRSVWAPLSAKHCAGTAATWVMPMWELLSGRAGRKALPAPWLPGTAHSLGVLAQLCPFGLWPRPGICRGLSLLDKLGGCVWVRHDSPC